MPRVGARVAPPSGLQGQSAEHGARARAAADADPPPDLDGGAQARHAAADGAPARGVPPDQPQHRRARPGRAAPRRVPREPAGPRHLRRRGAADPGRRRGAGASSGWWPDARSRAPAGLHPRGADGDARRPGPAGRARPRRPPAAPSSSSATARSSPTTGSSSRPSCRSRSSRCWSRSSPRARRPRPALLEDVRVVITTFFHIHEVKRAVPAGGPPTVALLSEANIQALLRLTELPEGTTGRSRLQHRQGQPEPPVVGAVRGPRTTWCRCWPRPTIPGRSTACSRRPTWSSARSWRPTASALACPRTSRSWWRTGGSTAAASRCCATCSGELEDRAALRDEPRGLRLRPRPHPRQLAPRPDGRRPRDGGADPRPRRDRARAASPLVGARAVRPGPRARPPTSRPRCSPSRWPTSAGPWRLARLEPHAVEALSALRELGPRHRGVDEQRPRGRRASSWSASACIRTSTWS